LGGAKKGRGLRRARIAVDRNKSALEVHSAATNRNRLLPISTSFNSGGLAHGFL
jgi:hypothetical protein